MVFLRFVIATAVLLLALTDAKAVSSWKPISAIDLKLTPSDIGDPDADAAILFRVGELNDNDPDGTNMKVYVRIKIFSDRGRKYAEVHLPYTLDVGRITDVKARTVRPDGTEVEVAGRDIYDRLMLKNQHSVLREKVFSLPGVQAGCIIEYRYRHVYPQGFRYFELDLQAELYIKHLEYRIQPQSASRFDVRWIAFNAPEPSPFTFAWDGSYIMKAHDIPPFRREPMMPPELAVKMWGWLYYSKDKETVADRFWRDYADRMYDVMTGETEPTGAIRRVVELITLAGDDTRRKIERIYDYVQTEVRLTPITSGTEDSSVEANRPNRNAEETLRRRVGTARDVNRLFVAMARAIGLDARIAELTTRDSKLFSPSFLDPFQFNSDCVAVLQPDGSADFYDPGTSFCPVGMLPWEKEAVRVLVYGSNGPRFIDTPVTPVDSNFEARRLRVTPHPDGTVDVHQEVTRGGQPALALRSEYAELSDVEQRRRVTDAIRRVLPIASVKESSVNLTNVSRSIGEQTISADFTVPEFAPRTDKRLLLKPALLNHLDESLMPAPKRSNKVYFPYPWTESDEITIEIPDGYEVERIPAPISIDAGAATYRASFRLEGPRVIYERRLVVNSIVVDVGKYRDLKEFFDNVHRADQAIVSFRR
ncbi:MAG TPA: DUF3857 domain-containing protein [Blastocatellia bacterium]|nr:DUF3857 domain-containing protein [Blastocatellia bacterium]